MPFLAVCTIPSDTSDDGDDIQNTFAIDTTATPEDIDTTQELALNAAFSAFYSGNVAPQAFPLSTWLSPVLDNNTNACRLDLYDLEGHLDGSPHGSPWSSSLFTLATEGGVNPLPSEVCLAVTLEASGRSSAPVENPDGADPGVAIDRPQQRRTGRLFIGPLRSTASSVIGGLARPTLDFTAAARQAVRNLDLAIDAAITSAGAGLGVWSRSDATIRGLEAVSTDDAFDIQRRRGEAPTARTRLTF